MPLRVRLGLIGFGRWGQNIARTCTALEHRLSLVAVASRNPRTPELVGSNCTVYTDWQRMLDTGGLDGIIIATPPSEHAQMALASIERGIPVLIEKPLTTDITQAESVRSAALTSGVPVMVDHIHLYGPAFRRMISLAGEMGPLKAIISVAGNHGPYRDDVSVLWDWGPHDIAMSLSLTGAAPVEVSARRLQHALIKGVVAENIEILQRFLGGAWARSTIGTLMDKRRKFTAFFDRGTLVYDDLAPDKLRLHPPGPPGDLPQTDGQVIKHDDSPPLLQVIGEFVEVVSGRCSVDRSVDMGVAVVKILKQAEINLGVQ